MPCFLSVCFSFSASDHPGQLGRRHHRLLHPRQRCPRLLVVVVVVVVVLASESSCRQYPSQRQLSATVSTVLFYYTSVMHAPPPPQPSTFPLAAHACKSYCQWLVFGSVVRFRFDCMFFPSLCVVFLVFTSFFFFA
jgi:hypothetical protein